MGKNSSSVSDSETTVFIDTSLGTHLAVAADQSDTVSALKAKIENEHHFCFTSMGKIKVEALKVERKGRHYHLSDSLLVKNAFIGVNDIWFLSADASNVPRKRLSSSDDSMPLLLEGKNCEKEKVTVSEQNVSFDTARKTSEEIETRVKHSGNDHCRTSFHEKVDRPEPELQEDRSLCSGRFHRRQECKEDSSKKDSDVACNASFGKDLPAEDKRQSKIKQKNKETVHLKEHDSFSYGFGKQPQQPDIVPPENSSGNQIRDVSCAIKIGKETTSSRDVLRGMATRNKYPTEAPSRSSVSRMDSRSDSRIHITDDTSKATVVPREDIENRKNTLVEDAPRSQAASLKKRKSESIAGVEGSLKENNIMVRGSNNEESKPEIASELASGAKQINANDLLDGLTAESSDLLTNSSSRRKTKKRKKTSNHVNEVFSAAPSGRDVMEESSMVAAAGIVDNNFGGEDDAASISGQGLQGVTPPEIGGSEEKLDSHPSVVVKVLSGGGTNWAERVDQERQSSQIKDFDGNDTKVIATSKLLDSNGTVTPNKKKRKSKKPKGSVEESQTKSGTQHIQGSEQVILLRKTSDAVHGEQSSDKAKEVESDLSQKNGKDSFEKESHISHPVRKADNLDTFGDPQNNEESTKKNMKKKSERTQSADTAKPSNLKAEVGIAGPQDPAPTTENRREVGNKRRNTKLEKTSSIVQLNGKAHESDKNHGIVTGSIPARSNSMAAESTKVSSHALEHTPEKKFSKKVLNTGTKAPSLDMSGRMNSKSEGAGKQSVDQSKMANKRQIEVSRNRLACGKATRIDDGEVVNSSGKMKSSATPLAIFKDDSSGSSEDEDEGGISEASTDTMSDCSLSSNYSEGESKLDMDSPRKGKAGEGSVKKSCSSDIKNMNWHELAVNSSTFKKAQLAASQSEELEDEIQPLDEDSKSIL